MLALTASIWAGGARVDVDTVGYNAFPGLTTRIQVHGSAGSAIVNGDQLEYFFSATDADRFGTHGFSAHAGAVIENQADEVVPAQHLTTAPKPPDNFIQGHARQYDEPRGERR